MTQPADKAAIILVVWFATEGNFMTILPNPPQVPIQFIIIDHRLSIPRVSGV
ncbi:hypothetical protein [Escherichia coli]|uniref:hypothetical protein n=1 Tax=Escherichia coli TaxID=562 RepID=UPI003EEF8E8D